MSMKSKFAFGKSRLLRNLVAGFVLSIVFQLAHTVEHTHFPLPDVSTGKMEDEWAIHQIKTTANFATRNKVISWLVGGLNFQIEHHLFPGVPRYQYPEIQKMVKKFCTENGIRYHETTWIGSMQEIYTALKTEAACR